jgi:Tol biopolymer transport system component
MVPVAAADQPGIYLVGLDGGDLRRLAPEGSHVSWSPDGRFVAYIAGPNSDVHVREFGGPDHALGVPLTNGNASFAWAPDSSRVAFPGPGDGPGQRDVWVADPTGREPARPIPAAGDDANVVWGPNGRLASMGELGIFTFGADGSGRKRIYDQALSYGDMDWSPDGRTIVAVPAGRDGLLIDQDGGNPRRLGGQAGDEWRGEIVSWSPSGGELVAGGRIDWRPGLSIVPAEGGEPRALARGSFYDPVWAPTGNVIAALAAPERLQRRQIVLVNPGGGDPRVLIEVPTSMALGLSISWAPDGGSIVFTVWKLTEPLGAPAPELPLGTRCGTPWGGGGSGAERTVVNGATTLTVQISVCELPAGADFTTYGEIDDPGLPVSVLFDFGDGSTHAQTEFYPWTCERPDRPRPLYPGASPHTYATAGEHTVTLTVTTVACDATGYPAPGSERTTTVTIPVFQG